MMILDLAALSIRIRCCKRTRNLVEKGDKENEGNVVTCERMSELRYHSNG